MAVSVSSAAIGAAVRTRTSAASVDVKLSLLSSLQFQKELRFLSTRSKSLRLRQKRRHLLLLMSCWKNLINPCSSISMQLGVVLASSWFLFWTK